MLENLLVLLENSQVLLESVIFLLVGKYSTGNLINLTSFGGKALVKKIVALIV